MNRLLAVAFSSFVTGSFVAGLLASTPLAQAEEAGVKPLKAFAASGEFAGQEVDFVAERKGQTTVYLFVNAENWTRPVARFLKVLDGKLSDGIEGAKDAQAVAVWLTSDVAKEKEYLPRAQKSLNLGQTALAVFEGPPQGPEGWNVDVASHLTAVVVRGGKEIARFKYQSTNDTDVPDVVKALQKQ